MQNPCEIALLLVDTQRMFIDREASGVGRNNPDAIKNIGQLLNLFRKYDWPLFHIRHSSTEPDSELRPERPGFQPVAELAEKHDEPVLIKHVNSAFIGTNLENILKSRGIKTILVTGITTNHCCETTARMGGNLGFDVRFISDATYTFDRNDIHGNQISAQHIHDMTLTNLDGEFAIIETTKETIASLMLSTEDIK